MWRLPAPTVGCRAAQLPRLRGDRRPVGCLPPAAVDPPARCDGRGPRGRSSFARAPRARAAPSPAASGAFHVATADRATRTAPLVARPSPVVAPRDVPPPAPGRLAPTPPSAYPVAARAGRRRRLPPRRRPGAPRDAVPLCWRHSVAVTGGRCDRRAHRRRPGRGGRGRRRVSSRRTSPPCVSSPVGRTRRSAPAARPDARAGPAGVAARARATAAAGHRVRDPDAAASAAAPRSRPSRTPPRPAAAAARRRRGPPTTARGCRSRCRRPRTRSSRWPPGRSRRRWSRAVAPRPRPPRRPAPRRGRRTPPRATAPWAFEEPADVDLDSVLDRRRAVNG